MKKKILSLCLVAALIAVAVVGSTLAYFTDTDQAVNVFTMGNVDIMLREDNDAGIADAEYRSWVTKQLLQPSITIEKDVWVENIGNNPAYVRVGVLVPADLEPMLEMGWVNTDTWKYSVDTAGNEAKAYAAEVDGVEYVGYTLTYNGALEGKTGVTPDLLTSVMLKDAVTCETLANGDIRYKLVENGETYTYATDAAGLASILIYAEAGQTTGNYGDDTNRKAWTTADEALNVMFGEPDVLRYFTDVKFASAPSDIKDALDAGSDITLPGDVKYDSADLEKNPYGTTHGMDQSNGGVIDGNGNTFDAGKATWAIETHGGTIKNLTITNAERGIVIYSPTEDVIVDNCVIDGPGYAINTAEYPNVDGIDLIVTNSTVKGWTSLAGIESATFTNCILGENTTGYWQAYGYDADFDRLIRPYSPLVLEDCQLEKDFYIDLSALNAGATVTIDNCVCNGVKITEANYNNYIEIELPSGRTLADCVIFK